MPRLWSISQSTFVLNGRLSDCLHRLSNFKNLIFMIFCGRKWGSILLQDLCGPFCFHRKELVYQKTCKSDFLNWKEYFSFGMDSLESSLSDIVLCTKNVGDYRKKSFERSGFSNKILLDKTISRAQ